MILKIGIETEDLGEVDSIQLSKGTDSNWRLYITLGNKIYHFNLDKILKGQEIESESLEAFVLSEGKTMYRSELKAKS